MCGEEQSDLSTIDGAEDGDDVFSNDVGDGENVGIIIVLAFQCTASNPSTTS